MRNALSTSADKGRDGRPARRLSCRLERGPRRFRSDPAHREASRDQFVRGPQRRRQRRRIEPGEGILGFVEASDQQHAANGEMLCE
jgi:hypothetical protein